MLQTIRIKIILNAKYAKIYISLIMHIFKFAKTELRSQTFRMCSANSLCSWLSGTPLRPLKADSLLKKSLRTLR